MSLTLIFSFIMSIVYLGAGVFLLLGKNIFQFTDFQRLGLVVIFISYGLFRFVNTVRKQKEITLDEKED
jgi:hypothetical protein